MATSVVLSLLFVPNFARWKGQQDKKKTVGRDFTSTFGGADVAAMGNHLQLQ